jgi:hypothetical protein
MPFQAVNALGARPEALTAFAFTPAPRRRAACFLDARAPCRLVVVFAGREKILPGR